MTLPSSDAEHERDKVFKIFSKNCKSSIDLVLGKSELFYLVPGTVRDFATPNRIRKTNCL